MQPSADSTTVNVRLLTAEDAPAYHKVRLEALKNDPLAFLTSAEEFAQRTPQQLKERVQSIPAQKANFGAFLHGELVGLTTLIRETAPILTHRVNIFGVSVAPHARGQGCADALMHSAIAHARTWEGVTSLHLAVMETQVAARKLYERHGFQVWGTQPDAIRRNGQTYAEHFLWRALTAED